MFASSGSSNCPHSIPRGPDNGVLVFMFLWNPARSRFEKGTLLWEEMEDM